MIFKKLPFYISSLWTIITNLHNPFSLLKYISGKSVILRFKNGIKLKTLQPLDPLIIKETFFDDEYKLRTLKNPSVIIDVGAALGDFAIMAAKVFPKAHIICFEPNRNEFSVLRENIKINHVKNIVLYMVAIGIKKSYTFFVAKYNVRSSIIKDNYSTQKITVSARRLDEFIKGEVDFVKIDCEGAELEVLASISSQKMKYIKQMVLEYHNHLIENEDIKITQVLQNRGFITSQKKDPYNSDIGYIYATASHK